MRARLPWLLFAITLAGCAAELDSEFSDLGGQTGSLVPPEECAVPAAELGELRVVEGDVAFVAHAQSGDAPLATLTDADGNEIELTFTELEGSDGLAAKTAQALTAGNYSLSYQCDGTAGPRRLDVNLQVDEAQPLPEELGDVRFEQEQPPSCEMATMLEFSIELGEEAHAFAQLLELSLQVDEERPFVVAHYGTLQSDATTTFQVPRCFGAETKACIPSRSVSLELTAELAGEEVDIEPLPFEVDASCIPRQDEGGCSTSSAPDGHLRWPWFAFAFTAMLLTTGRRRASHPLARHPSQTPGGRR
jgi:MYXO-CTERM domain-containing protein